MCEREIEREREGNRERGRNRERERERESEREREREVGFATCSLETDATFEMPPEAVFEATEAVREMSPGSIFFWALEPFGWALELFVATEAPRSNFSMVSPDASFLFNACGLKSLKLLALYPSRSRAVD